MIDHERMEREYTLMHSEMGALESLRAEAKLPENHASVADYYEIGRQSEEAIAASRRKIVEDFVPFLEKTRRLLDPYDGRPVVLKLVAHGQKSAGISNIEVANFLSRLSQKMGWEVSTEYEGELEHGLVSAREITMSITGRDAWRFLQHEAGIHTVQSPPLGLRDARKFTNKIGVSVRPELLPTESKIKDGDIERFVSRSGGPGGQGVNTTDSSVQLIHKPTGISVRAQSQRSQLENRKLAMRILAVRVGEHYENLDRAAAGRAFANMGDGNVRTYDLVGLRIRDSRFQSNVGVDDFLNGNYFRDNAAWFDETAIRRLLSARP